MARYATRARAAEDVIAVSLGIQARRLAHAVVMADDRVVVCGLWRQFERLGLGTFTALSGFTSAMPLGPTIVPCHTNLVGSCLRIGDLLGQRADQGVARGRVRYPLGG